MRRDPPPVPLGRFLDLTAQEVEHEAILTRSSPAVARTWESLGNLMRRDGYGVVRELGIPAANAWASHLGVCR
jgi:hypothetical protein